MINRKSIKRIRRVPLTPELREDAEYWLRLEPGRSVVLIPGTDLCRAATFEDWESLGKDLKRAFGIRYGEDQRALIRAALAADDYEVEAILEEAAFNQRLRQVGRSWRFTPPPNGGGLHTPPGDGQKLQPLPLHGPVGRLENLFSNEG